MKDGTDVLFFHENGRLIPGIYKGQAQGAGCKQYVLVHVEPKTLITFNLDRSKRHREEGMTRHVLKERIV